VGEQAVLNNKTETGMIVIKDRNVIRCLDFIFYLSLRNKITMIDKGYGDYIINRDNYLF